MVEEDHERPASPAIVNGSGSIRAWVGFRVQEEVGLPKGAVLPSFCTALVICVAAARVERGFDWRRGLEGTGAGVNWGELRWVLLYCKNYLPWQAGRHLSWQYQLPSPWL